MRITAIVEGDHSMQRQQLGREISVNKHVFKQVGTIYINQVILIALNYHFGQGEAG